MISFSFNFVFSILILFRLLVFYDTTHCTRYAYIYIEFLVEPIMHIYIINVSQTTILINSHIHTCIAIYNFSYICMLPSEPVALA